MTSGHTTIPFPIARTWKPHRIFETCGLGQLRLPRLRSKEVCMSRTRVRMERRPQFMKFAECTKNKQEERSNRDQEHEMEQ